MFELVASQSGIALLWPIDLISSHFVVASVELKM
jgi:hypothetical protein